MKPGGSRSGPKQARREYPSGPAPATAGGAGAGGAHKFEKGAAAAGSRYVGPKGSGPKDGGSRDVGPKAAGSHDVGLPPAFPAILRVVLSAGIILALATPSSCNLLWGVNLWSLFPAPARIAVGFLALGAVWWRARGQPGARPSGPTTGTRAAITPGLIAAGLALLAAWIFLRARTLVFGDSLNFLYLLGEGKPFGLRSPLYAAILNALAGHPPSGRLQPGLRMAQALSSVLGPVLLGLLAWLWRRDHRGQGCETAVVLLGGYLCLFQGYVEAYGLALVALAWFLIEISASPDRRNRVRIPVAFAMLVLAHGYALLLAPVAGWALLGSRNRLRNGLILGGVLAAAVVVLFAVRDRLPGQAVLLDPVKTAQLAGSVLRGIVKPKVWTSDYGVLSWMQLADILNGLLLAASPAVLLLAVLAVTRTGRRALGAELRTAAGAAALLFLLGRAIIRTPVGVVRDWDLFAFLVFPLVLLTLRVWARPEFAAVRRRLAMALLAAAIVFIAPKTLALQSDEAGIRRVLNWVNGRPPQPPAVAARALVNVGESHLKAKNLLGAATQYTRAFRTLPVVFYGRRAALLWQRAGENARADSLFTQVLALDSTDAVSWTERGFLRIDRRDLPAAEKDFRTALRYDPDQPSALFGAAMVTLERGGHDAGRAMMRRAAVLMEPDDPRRPTLDALLRLLASRDSTGAAPQPGPPGTVPPPTP